LLNRGLTVPDEEKWGPHYIIYLRSDYMPLNVSSTIVRNWKFIVKQSLFVDIN